MWVLALVLGMTAMLFMPVYANAQTNDRIVLLDNFGDYERNDHLFVFGQVSNVLPDSYLIMEIINPEGDLCQIQQLIPLSDGSFFTDAIPLSGRICGISGDYQIKLFYGDYKTTTEFLVTNTIYSKPSIDDLVNKSEELISNQIQTIDNEFGIDSSFTERLNTSVEDKNISELEELYVDLWSEFFIDDLILDVDPAIRPAVESALNSISVLLDSNELEFEIAKSVEKSVFSSVFYHNIGDSKKSIDLLSDVFIDIRNVNPEKIETKRAPTFDELEDTLLNLMTKSDTIMSELVKEEIAFIFARGTAPLHTDELSELLELLSQSRYLDIISRNESDLYRLIQNDWDNLKPSFESKESINDLLESKPRISDLFQAVIILRDLDDVDRFIHDDSEENSELANLILPDWNSLESQLSLATSVDDIIESENEVQKMKQVIDISSRISKAVEISQSTNVDSPLVDDWEQLLVNVEQANSIDEILQIVSEFDSDMNELREKRNPLNILKFEYQKMKEQSQLQADYQNLFLIDNALKIIQTAEDMQSGNPSITRIDRIEVLLTWASEMAPKIKSDLDAYNRDALEVRASDILQRAKSIENLVELSMTKNRFLPGYIEYADDLNEKIDEARDLVIKNDLDAADSMVRNLFDEWRDVSAAYEEDPYGSEVGYSADELKRIEYREKLQSLSDLVSDFNHSGFAPHMQEYNELTSDAYEYIEYGNFVDTENKIQEIGEFLTKTLPMDNSKIMYDISYDDEKDIWILQGSVDKPVHDRRENLYVTVYDIDGSKNSSLEFTDTKHGDYFTQWNAPATPGLYVVMLQYQDAKASQIVHVEENFDTVYTPSDLNMVELARDFEELKTFMEEFGGDNYKSNPRFSSVLNDIQIGLTNRDAENVDEKLDELKQIIERYLPTRSRSAVIEAEYSDDGLFVSGAVQKTLAFREDLFVDVFDQQGNLVYEIALKDDSSGLFNEVLSEPFLPGVYVTQLQYHDVIVNDFFNVR